ncbi:hypothetical protein ACFW7J_11255 [Streptomyces sp. NPDC059525]|uniref:hypothetical protein n=1 Tax=Streptomyces sp. NPDC059525 TaxID=3346857 RepID=UPI003674300A
MVDEYAEAFAQAVVDGGLQDEGVPAFVDDARGGDAVGAAGSDGDELEPLSQPQSASW